jgi:hypothetical protein
MIFASMTCWPNLYDNQPRTITQSYWLIEIAQQKDWHAHFEFQLMICDIAK